jgi:tyrosyl-tRNA synthetase
VKTINVIKMVSAGCKVKISIADCFVQLNNKMGGDLKKIQTVGHYMTEIWKAAGMNLDGVEFLWSSNEINKRAHEYWPIVMDIARKTTSKDNEVHPCLCCVSIKSLILFESLTMNMAVCAYYEVCK